MRILRVTSDYYPYVLGGIPIHTKKLSQIQSKNKHEIMIFTCINEDFKQINETINITIRNYGRKISLFGNTFCLNMLFDLIKYRNRYDIIDAHSHLYISTNLAAIVSKIFHSSPLIITNHGLRSQAVPRLFQEIYLKTVAKFCFNVADAVITFTNTEKEDMIGIGVHPSKIVVIPNSIDTNEFYPQNKQLNTTFNIIWVGRLCAGKGLKYAILAFEKFIEKFNDARLYIIGDGPYYERTSSYLIKKNLTQNIILKGRIENRDMISYYNKSSVYLMTSMSEGMPRTLLEAMACEIPVICTDIPQLIPIIKEGGIIIPKQNINAIVSALEYFANNPEKRREYGKSGRNLILEKYSLEKMNKDTENLYREVIKRRTRNI